MAIKSTIDDEKTFEAFGYRSEDLGAKSGLHVVTICAGCGNPRATETFINIQHQYMV